MKSETKSLLVVSHVQHYQWEGKLWAFGPYAREIDIWADLFSSIIICSPCKNCRPTGECLPFTRTNISISPVEIHGGGSGLSAKLQLISSLPSVIWALYKSMRKAWAIHVRLPGNIGAIGAILAPLFSDRIVAKYAGTWPDFDGEPCSYRLQKKILKSRWFRGPVTVYGHWPNQPAHIIPFFTSILTEDQIIIAKDAAKGRILHSPARILFVGRFDKGKNAHILLDALNELKHSSVPFEARIIGDGIEKNNLHHQSRKLDLEKEVLFTGAIPFLEVLENYKWGDILVLTSENAEGWPKAIAEGMAFGLVCFGSQRGLIPQMLDGGKGKVIWPVTAQNLSSGLREIISSPEEFVEISKRAAAWSQAYSLDGLREAIKELVKEQWHILDDFSKVEAEGAHK